MTAEQAQREPTMEEILASIRRIISEEDKPDEAGSDVLDLHPEDHPSPPALAEPAPAPVAEKAPPPAPAPEPEPAFEVAAHVARNSTPARALEDDFMIVESEPEPPAPEPVQAPPPRATAPSRPMDDDALVSEPTATKAAGALGKLMGSMMVSNGGTLDDVVRELLKPMLKEWLDANLNAIVEAEVAKEIDRIRRLAR